MILSTAMRYATVLRLGFFIVALSAGVLRGESAETLEALSEKWESDRKTIETDFEARFAKLTEGYIQALKKSVASATERGDLNGVLIGQTEIHRVKGEESAVPAPEPGAKSEEMENLKSIFESESADLVQARDKGLADARGGFLARLLALEKQLTTDGDLESAIAVNKVRVEAEKEQSEWESSRAGSEEPKVMLSVGPTGKPGSLRSVGKFFEGGEVLPPEVAEINDFVRVYAFERAWIAFRESGEG
ncbi:MAG: hypothetical protein AAGA58_04990, partial [Verrucomicrobiota bacterium]